MAEKYLVIGGLGLVGRAVVTALERDGVDVVALSRRTPQTPGQARWLSVDLTDRAACADAFRSQACQGVTNIVYCALYERDDLIGGWRHEEQIRTNARMLENVLNHLQPARHLTLLQGTKAYGAHLRPMSLPGKEWQPRPDGANFYWNQEDLVRERAAAGGWTFSILRPQIVCGVAQGSPMNTVAAIGVLAAVQQAQGLPFAFPGGGDFVTEATDADLLAEAVLWAGRHEVAAGETYNVTNGDVIHWPSLWPELGRSLGVDVGDPQPLRLAEEMPKHAAIWNEVVRTRNLRAHSMQDLVGASWQFADAVFGYGGGARSTLLSTIKIREHGFHACVDSATMFARQFDAMRALRWLP